MRKVLIPGFLMFATAAQAEDMGNRAYPVNLPPDHRRDMATPLPPVYLPWSKGELIGDTMGRWLGMRGGKLDVFDQTLAFMGEDGPVLSGTIRKNAAEIQLRWHPGE